MKTITHNKLVRDKIPQIITQAGKSCRTEILSDAQYIEALNTKLLEEVNEYLESGSVEELADIGEVLRAILAVKGVRVEEYEQLRLEKRDRRGAFADKVFLKEVTEEQKQS